MPARSEHMCLRFQKAMDILGQRWMGMIVLALTEQPRRFGELAAHLQIISERMLSERLKELVAEGIVERRVIPETPVQVEYRLTAKGEALHGVMKAITHWADRWVEPPEGAKRR